jgi:hypothetical protein
MVVATPGSAALGAVTEQCRLAAAGAPRRCIPKAGELNNDRADEDRAYKVSRSYQWLGGEKKMGMPSQEEKQAHFRELVDRIGPGIRLEVDDVVLKSVFGKALGESFESVVDRAREFAERSHCGCIHRAGDTYAVFVRAYFKKG